VIDICEKNGALNSDNLLSVVMMNVKNKILLWAWNMVQFTWGRADRYRWWIDKVLDQPLTLPPASTLHTDTSGVIAYPFTCSLVTQLAC